MAGSPSRFVWYELMTPDPAAAQAFYAAVVGWGAQDASQPGKPYRLLTVPGPGRRPAGPAMSGSRTSTPPPPGPKAWAARCTPRPPTFPASGVSR